MHRRLYWFAASGCLAIIFTACGRQKDTMAHASYVPLVEVEASYGPLITSGNHPTLDQNGTGERLGLFEDKSGTVWGLPLSVGSNGAVLACAPAALRDAKVSDTFPAGSRVIGSTNQPTGWRGGTGDLELLLRDQNGTIRWQAVHGAQLDNGPVCWAPESPGPPVRLYYYRLAPVAGK